MSDRVPVFGEGQRVVLGNVPPGFIRRPFGRVIGTPEPGKTAVEWSDGRRSVVDSRALWTDDINYRGVA